MNCAPLEVRLLGGTAILAPAGEHLRLASAKALALFVYLLLTAPRLQTRDRLADLLWPMHSREQARANLRQTLARLRRALVGDADVLIAEGENLGLRSERIRSDARQLVTLAQSDDVQSLQRALDLYAGELLAGFSIDAPGFDEWLLVERQRHLDLVVGAARRLLSLHRDADRTEEAIRIARRLLTLDSLQEDVHRTLLTLYAESGRKDAAQSHFRDLEQLLREELDAEPDAATQDLMRQIADGKAIRPAPPRLTEALDQAVTHLRAAAQAAHRRGAHAEAATLFTQTLAVLRTAGRLGDSVEFDLRAALQRELYADGRLEDALDELQRMAARAEAAADPVWLTRVHCDEAQVLRTLGRLEEATEQARRALAGAQSLNDPHLQALANLRLGAIHFAVGAYQRALPLLLTNVELFDEALGAVEDSSEPGNPAVRTRSWIAWTCAELGRFDDGRIYGDQGVTLADEDREMYARVHSRIARGVLELRGEVYEAAAVHLQAALTLARQAELTLFEPFIVPALALALAQSGEIGEARSLLAGFRLAAAQTLPLSTLAEANRLIGRPELALEMASRALAAMRASGRLGEAARARYALGRGLAAAGESSAAHQELATARDEALALAMAPLARQCAAALDETA